ncbi:hypothetical protein ADIMK_0506 [Marinobacterium lacunae]|uniref:Uncharacterized protein n=1 Tax=Marinobacterium lacunae TaxID=1232683 RepID=A0A081G444_9GAMM|nr:tetratricopeptide repeat protein [Marinobacterium lacunae]KEA65549.1 hypothetical protein ADIMK_0506 [Marinobacterium lacunae]MBR9883103.1 tetratricopeptide repeat protein [Oceanospirillales bacterium]
MRSGKPSATLERLAVALILPLILTGCGAFQDTPQDSAGNYCLSAGKDQSYDCSKPVAELYTGPLRIRDLPIDDETLYSRVEEIKLWLAQQRAILSGEAVEPANDTDSLIPPAPDSIEHPSAHSTPEETLTAALALTDRGDFSTALSLISEYKTLKPEDLTASLIESRILLQSGDLNAAETLLREQIKLNPRVPELYNNLAAVQAADGNVGDAITTLQQAFATDPSFARIQQNLKTLYTSSANQAMMPDLEPQAPKLNMIDVIPNRQ